MSDADRLDQGWLRRRGSIKWALHGDDVIPAWVAEMDYPTPPVALDALRDLVDREFTGYLPPPLMTGLPQETARWLAANGGPVVEPEQIQLTADVLQGVRLALDAYSSPDTAVVVPVPSYPPFFAACELVGRDCVPVPLVDDDGTPRLDLDGIEAALRDGAATVILCNPYNPVGRAFSRSELSALAEVVERHGGRVISDEIHRPLVFPGHEHVAYATVSDAAARHSVTLISPAKGWNLAGLKCAQLVLTNPDDAEAYAGLNFLVTHGAANPGVVASLAVYQDGGPWLTETIDRLDRNRHLLADLVAEHLPQVSYRLPEATFLAWLDCRELGLDNPAEHFLEHARVALNDGATFGAGYEGFVRLNFATSPDILTEVVERMGRSLR